MTLYPKKCAWFKKSVLLPKCLQKLKYMKNGLVNCEKNEGNKDFIVIFSE